MKRRYGFKWSKQLPWSHTELPTQRKRPFIHLSTIEVRKQTFHPIFWVKQHCCLTICWSFGCSVPTEFIQLRLRTTNLCPVQLNAWVLLIALDIQLRTNRPSWCIPPRSNQGPLRSGLFCPFLAIYKLKQIKYNFPQQSWAFFWHPFLFSLYCYQDMF